MHTYYRFFGARHSIVQLGYLIDFETQHSNKNFLPTLRSVSQINFPWIVNKNRLILWHHFIKLIERHIEDAHEINSFYFTLLLDSAKKWEKQNPKRIICESYLKLLAFEGRIYSENNCFICETPLDHEISLMQGFKFSHPLCLNAPSIDKSKINAFFTTQKTTLLEDSEIDYLYSILLKGL